MSQNTIHIESHKDRKADPRLDGCVKGSRVEDDPARGRRDQKSAGAKHASGLPINAVRQMQEAFFDVAPDGALIYVDPMIGSLRSAARRLAVAVNAERHQLELVHEGRVLKTFGLTDRAQDACEEAFAAYFLAIQQLCGGQQPDVKAA